MKWPDLKNWYGTPSRVLYRCDKFFNFLTVRDRRLKLSQNDVLMSTLFCQNFSLLSLTVKKLKILSHRYSTQRAAQINFLSRVTSTKHKVCLKPILVKIQAFSNAFQNYNFYLEKVVTKKNFFFSWPLFEKIVGGKQLLYICVWFSTKKFFNVSRHLFPYSRPLKKLVC